MSASNFLENEVLDHVLAVGSYTAPGTVYTALYESNPGEDNSGTETAYTGYARIATTYNAAVNGTSDNSGAITFGVNTGSSVTITHFAIYDAVTAGNMLVYGVLNASRTFNTNDQPKFNSGDLDISLD